MHNYNVHSQLIYAFEIYVDVTMKYDDVNHFFLHIDLQLIIFSKLHSRTPPGGQKNRCLGLGPEDYWSWLWPWPGRIGL